MELLRVVGTHVLGAFLVGSAPRISNPGATPRLLEAICAHKSKWQWHEHTGLDILSSKHEARHAQRPTQAQKDKEDTLSVDQIGLLKIVRKSIEDVRG